MRLISSRWPQVCYLATCRVSNHIDPGSRSSVINPSWGIGTYPPGNRRPCRSVRARCQMILEVLLGAADATTSVPSFCTGVTLSFKILHGVTLYLLLHRHDAQDSTLPNVCGETRAATWCQLHPGARQVGYAAGRGPVAEAESQLATTGDYSGNYVNWVGRWRQWGWRCSHTLCCFAVWWRGCPGSCNQTQATAPRLHSMWMIVWELNEMTPWQLRYTQTSAM